MTTAQPSLFIDGEWIASDSSDRIDVIGAATESVLGSIADAVESDVDAAVAAARRALAGPWGSLTGGQRAALIEKFAAALTASGRETALLVSQENGMPISLSKGANGFAPAQIIGYYGQLAKEMVVEEERKGFFGNILVRTEPVGVVGAIVPWNYPQGLAAMKIGPALAAGCTIVLKTSPETSLDARVFAEAALAADLPPGVLNIVSGGRRAGEALVAHPGVDKIAFTGSTAAGRAIAESCGRMLRPVTLELGGKSAAIIADDADLDDFSRALLDVCLPNNGQTCHASTRILAPASRYAEVVETVTEKVRGLAVGDPLEKTTQIGPLASHAQQQRVLSYVAAGRDSGARLTTGGRVPTGQDRGWYVEPTVFADVDNASVIAQEEIFGPVLCVIRYDGVDDAVRIANQSDFGLAGAVFTSDEESGRDIARRIQTGTFGVNIYNLEMTAPFGGMKSSGLGRELGPEGLQDYVSLKSIYITK